MRITSQKRFVLVMIVPVSLLALWIASTFTPPRYSLRAMASSGSPPQPDNLWHKYKGPGGGALQTEGIRADKDRHGKPRFGTGTYPWNPGPVTIEVDGNRRITQNGPSKIIPVGAIGTVYYKVVQNRRKLPTLSETQKWADAQAEPPTNSISFVVWVQPPASEWPEVTARDLTKM